VEPPGAADDGAAGPPPLLTLGFRPFFLLAGAAAVILMGYWIHAYGRGTAVSAYYSGFVWHGHEMLFGYTGAVIAGFMLTAVRNWTKQDTLRGPALAALAILWLAARLLAFLPAAGWMLAVVDTAFFPCLGIAIARPLLRAGDRKNLVLLVMLTALTAANLGVHLELLGLVSGLAQASLRFGVYVVVLLIALIGGRVLPFFTERALPGAKIQRWRAVEITALGGLLLLIIVDTAAPNSLASVLIACLVAVAHGTRWVGWHSAGVWRVPLLWVLYLGYGWLIVGLLLTAAGAAGWIGGTLALHAFTTGAIGVMTMGMMTRIGLGHTGRTLTAPLSMAIGFALINLAAIARVAGPLVMPDRYPLWITTSGLLWAAAFLIYVVVAAPVLIRARADGGSD